MGRFEVRVASTSLTVYGVEPGYTPTTTTTTTTTTMTLRRRRTPKLTTLPTSSASHAYFMRFTTQGYTKFSRLRRSEEAALNLHSILFFCPPFFYFSSCAPTQFCKGRRNKNYQISSCFRFVHLQVSTCQTLRWVSIPFFLLFLALIVLLKFARLK